MQLHFVRVIMNGKKTVSAKRLYMGGLLYTEEKYLGIGISYIDTVR